MSMIALTSVTSSLPGEQALTPTTSTKAKIEANANLNLVIEIPLVWLVSRITHSPYLLN